MSVQPYFSKQDPDPYDPNAPAPASGSAGPPIPKNAPVPELSMVWSTALEFAPGPMPGTSQGGGSGSAPGPSVVDYSIRLQTLYWVETALLQLSSSIVDAYESLKNLFESGRDSVFGQQATMISPHIGDSQNYAVLTVNGNNDGPETVADPIQANAIAFAEGTEGQPGMNDAEAYTLQQVGNAMAVLGRMIMMMSKAGYAYVSADFNSQLPPATSTSPSSSSQS